MNGNAKTDWLAAVLYPLAVILMESFWVYPWLAWLGSWPMYAEARPALSLASVIVVLAVALVVTRFLSRRGEWSLTVVRSAIVGLGIAVFLVVLRLEYAPAAGTGWFTHAGQMLATSFETPSTILIAMTALVYLWWRGIILGRTTAQFKDIYRSFIFGMVAVILLIIIWQISGASERFGKPGPEIGWNVIAFFFFGLLAIAVCHLYNMRRSMPREEAALTSVWRWLPIMLGAVGGMILVGLGIVSIFSPAFFTTIRRGVGAVFDLVSTAAGWVAIPLNYIVEAVLWVVKWFLNLLRSDLPGQGGYSANVSAMEFPKVTTHDIPPEMILVVKWVVVIVLVAAVIYMLARAIGRFRDPRAWDDIEEIHESLWSWAGLKDDLKDLLGNMRKREARKGAPKWVRSFEDDLSGSLDVREIYRRILWEASRSGLPRQRHETAGEYARRIGRLVPESAGPLDGITDAYAGVRYGETAPGEERVGGVNLLWQALRGILRKRRGE